MLRLSIKFVSCALTLLVLPWMAYAKPLEDRYSALNCAIVSLKADGSSGTGVFIDGDGHILTAAHVILDRTFEKLENGSLYATIRVKNRASAITSGGQIIDINTQIFDENDLVASTKDLVVVSTGAKTNCFIPLDKEPNYNIGKEVIAIGFPGSVKESVLYQGFISSKHANIHAVGPVTNLPGQSITNTYDVFRVQMPITPGASGSPVISSNDTVIGIVSEVPVIVVADIERLIAAYVGSNPRGGVLINDFDTNRLLAQLAFIVKNFETPGSGLAVPIQNVSKKFLPR